MGLPAGAQTPRGPGPRCGPEGSANEGSFVFPPTNVGIGTNRIGGLRLEETIEGIWGGKGVTRGAGGRHNIGDGWEEETDPSSLTSSSRLCDNNKTKHAFTSKYGLNYYTTAPISSFDPLIRPSLDPPPLPPSSRRKGDPIRGICVPVSYLQTREM